MKAISCDILHRELNNDYYIARKLSSDREYFFSRGVQKVSREQLIFCARILI